VDLRKGIPFPDATFDGVYHSHVLEHFSRDDARALLSECFRVLKVGGILRIVLPDLEKLARDYLRALERADSDCDDAAYEWATLELLDQMVRDRPGGSQLAFLKLGSRERDIAIARGDLEIMHIANNIEATASEKITDHRSAHGDASQREKRWNHRGLRQESFIQLLLGNRYNALAHGEFRLSGEVHKWMYDRFSLSLLLKKSGFGECRVCSPSDSLIRDWSSFCLDTEDDGTIYKPSSLFMEGKKILSSLP
jgi:hypothetical protein